jgi:hypothetical protein
LIPKDEPPSRDDDEHPPAAVSSVVEIVSRHVTDLAPAPTEEFAKWVPGLNTPAGWQIGHAANNPVLPTRVAVCGRDSGAGWDGCDVINAFRFTGIPPESQIRDNADCTLRDLNASSITSYALAASSQPHIVAVRSSGYFDLVGRRIWGQYSTYLRGAETQGEGILIEHCIFVDSDSRARLRDDVTELSDTVHEAFLAMIDTVDDDDPTAPLPVMEVHQDGP